MYSELSFGSYQDEFQSGGRWLVSSLVACAAVLAALGAGYWIGGQTKKQVVQPEVLDIKFVEKVEAAPPPPPPPPPPVLKKPTPPPPVQPTNVPKHIKKVVVKKLPVAKKVKVPVKIKKTTLAEADPANDSIFVLEGAGVADGDAAPSMGVQLAHANPAPLPAQANPPKPSRGNPSPVYPAEAKAAGVESTVILKIVVGTDGTVQIKDVIAGDEPFVSAAREAVQHWRYAPATKGGKPMAVFHIVKIPFKIRA